MPVPQNLSLGRTNDSGSPASHLTDKAHAGLCLAQGHQRVSVRARARWPCPRLAPRPQLLWPGPEALSGLTPSEPAPGEPGSWEEPAAGQRLPAREASVGLTAPRNKVAPTVAEDKAASTMAEDKATRSRTEGWDEHQR